MTFGLVSLLCILALWRTLAAAQRLRETSLLTAQRWSVAAWATWLAVAVMQWRTSGDPPRWLDGIWYAAGVLALTPAIAVLGAKRPGVRVWSWFVLLPLVAVFVLPVLAPNWLSTTGWDLRVPLPLIVGFAVVLLMGAGNYVGTRYALPAGVYAVAVCLVVGPLSDAAPPLPWTAAELRVAATTALALAVLWADRQSRRATLARWKVEHLWFEFRETFGIVWGRRLLERVNQRAEAEGWIWRLSDGGWTPVPARTTSHSTAELLPGVAAPDADPRIEHTLRWLLRRFVDPSWIDRRLSGEAYMQRPEEAAGC